MSPEGVERYGPTMTDLSTSTSITVRAPATAVWRAITVPDVIKRWFFGVDTETDWTVGSPIVHRGTYQGKPYVDRGVVLRFEPPRHLVHTHWSEVPGVASGPEHAQEVTWDVAEHEGATTLTVSERNLPSPEARATSETAWRTALDSLKTVVETT